jgi:hypothetical protein
MIECGSLEYAQARVHARHGSRIDEAAWRRIEVMRDFAALLELARGTALRPWLVGITAESKVHRIEAVLRGHWRELVAEVVAWMPPQWQRALAWCALLPDLAPLQHLARGGEPAPWMRDDDAWRELCTAKPQARAGMLASGPHAALMVAWTQPQALAQAWQAEWRRRLPQPIDAAGATMVHVVHALRDHDEAFAGAAAGQGWLLRAALRARLSLLLRRAALEPAVAFIHVALCALDLERLRAELLRRALFARWTVA